VSTTSRSSADGGLEHVAVLERARALLDVGRPGEALRLLSAHVASVPDDAAALCLTALCQLRLDQPEAAEQAASAAARLTPQDEWPHRLRSCALRELGRIREAVAAAREAVRLAPDAWEPHVELATALLATRWQKRQAYPVAKRAVELAPEEANAHVALGVACSARGRRREERAAYLRALELDPGHVLALNNLAATDVDRGRPDRGLGLLVTALRGNPHEPVLRDNLDALAVWVLVRVLIAKVIGGLVLGVLLVNEEVGAVPAWWPRTLTGLVVILLCDGGTWLVVRRLPAGVRRHLRGLPRRLRGRERVLGIGFVVMSLSLLGMAFLPREAAYAASVPVILAVPTLPFAVMAWLIWKASWLLRR